MTKKELLKAIRKQLECGIVTAYAEDFGAWYYTKKSTIECEIINNDEFEENIVFWDLQCFIDCMEWNPFKYIMGARKWKWKQWAIVQIRTKRTNDKDTFLCIDKKFL